MMIILRKFYNKYIYIRKMYNIAVPFLVRVNLGALFNRREFIKRGK